MISTIHNTRVVKDYSATSVGQVRNKVYFGLIDESGFKKVGYIPTNDRRKMVSCWQIDGR
jgi:hypothetical protein